MRHPMRRIESVDMSLVHKLETRSPVPPRNFAGMGFGAMEVWRLSTTCVRTAYPFIPFPCIGNQTENKGYMAVGQSQ